MIVYFKLTFKPLSFCSNLTFPQTYPRLRDLTRMMFRRSLFPEIESERHHDEERETDYLYDFDEVLECEKEKIRSSGKSDKMTVFF